MQAETINILQEKFYKNLRVAMPCIIEKYDFATRKATVKINMLELTGDENVTEYPLISNVPVITSISGGAIVSLPIKKGDSCLILFADRDITNWLKGGNNLKPSSKRMHSLTDAVALMGLTTFATKTAIKNNDDVVINYDGSAVTLKPKGVVEILSAKELNIKTDKIVVNCNNADINVQNDVKILCKNSNIKCDTSNIECSNSNVKATSAINLESPMLTQKGNCKIDGNIEITGTSLLSGAVTSSAGITNSGGNLVSNNITFESHKHLYNDVTQVITAEGPATLIKSPANSQNPV